MPVIAVLTAIVLLLSSSAAEAREPVVSYVKNEKLRLYDLELDERVRGPKLTIPGMVPRFAVSLDGRYVFYSDEGELHLFDRKRDAERAASRHRHLRQPRRADRLGHRPGRPSTTTATARPSSTTAKAKDFVETGLDAMNGHRQTELSLNGRFLATTCVTDCEEDLGGDASAFVQDLSNGLDTAFPDDLTGADDEDEEHPCVNGSGRLVGIDITNPMQRDIFIYDRAAGEALDLPGLNDPMKDDTYCNLDKRGDYIGYFFDNSEFRVYDVAAGDLLELPELPFTTASSFSRPFDG